MVELVDVKKTFNLGQPNEYTAVDHLTLSLEENKLTVLKGPSGSGKTTLLSLIGCMARPTSGRIKLRLRGGIPGFSGNGRSLKYGEPAELDVTSLPGTIPDGDTEEDLRLYFPAVSSHQGNLGAGQRHAARLSAGRVLRDNEKASLRNHGNALRIPPGLGACGVAVRR